MSARWCGWRRARALFDGSQSGLSAAELLPTQMRLSPTDPSSAAMGGISGTTLPDEMALINTVMDVLPDPVCEQLLAGFMNDLYT